MLFLTNELAKKAKIIILLARETTRPGFQAGASWVENQWYMGPSLARDSQSRPLNQPNLGFRLFFILFFQYIS